VNKTNLTVSTVFLVFGLFLVASAYRLPTGMGRLPGPGFFPGVVGVAVILLASLLLAASLRDRRGAEFRVDNGRALAATAGLLAAYLLLWGRTPFALRTALLLALFLLFLGERWKPAIAVATVLTVAVVLAFQYGLHVNLR
jgi:hypothetical protein